MKKSQLLNLKPPLLKQRLAQKSPIPSHGPTRTIHDTSLDNLCKTEREKTGPKVPGLSIVSPTKGVSNEDDAMEVLVKATDRAIEALKNGNDQFALKTLQDVEKDLEQEAAEGKILDRNLIITCLYNMACVYQAMWALDDCLKYIDAVIYNLDESLIQEHPKSPKHSKSSPQKSKRKVDTAAIASKLRKQNLLLKIYLQQSAILSHLERHNEAYSRVKDAQHLMESMIQDLLSASIALKVDDSSHSKSSHRELLVNCTYAPPSSALTSSRAREAYSFFKDEVSYTKSLVDYAEPFLKDFIRAIDTLSQASIPETLKRAKKALSTWKASTEGKQKSARKGLSRNGPLFSNETKTDTRSLLGVQHTADWMETFNIDSIIQMNPLRYREYAQKRDIANYLSQDALQEKAIYQSVVFFMIGTEMRFLESSEHLERESEGGKNGLNESSAAEIYHLKAIDVVCRYITGPCAYIDHLTARYFKHYGQDLKPKSAGPPAAQVEQESPLHSEPAQAPEQRKTATGFLKPNLNLGSKPLEDVEAIKNNTRSPKHAEEPMRVEHVPSTFSLINKVSQKIVEEGKSEKKTLALRLRKLGDELAKSTGGKVPVIKLSPRMGDTDLEDAQPPSAEKNKNQSPKANLATPLSQASTSMSPIWHKEDKEAEEKHNGIKSTYFDIKKNMPVPTLRLHGLDKAEKNRQINNSSIVKPSATRENGSISQRNIQDLNTSARNKSSELQKWVTKIHGANPLKRSLRADPMRFDMYKEFKRVVSPQTKRESAATFRKRELTLPDSERGESLKSHRMVESFSRDQVLTTKAGNSSFSKEGSFPTPSKYIKTRQKTIQGKPKEHKIEKAKVSRVNKSELLKYGLNEKSVEERMSLESVEEFNNSNM